MHKVPYFFLRPLLPPLSHSLLYIESAWWGVRMGAKKVKLGVTKQNFYIENEII